MGRMNLKRQQSRVYWNGRVDRTSGLLFAQPILSIASDPKNLPAINILAGMGILTDDDGLVDAALSEVVALPIDQKRELDPQRDVDYLLIQHGLSQV